MVQMIGMIIFPCMKMVLTSYDMAEVLSKGKIDVKTNKIYQKHLYLKNTIVYPATDEEMDLFSIKYKLNKPGKDWIRFEAITVKLLGKPGLS